MDEPQEESVAVLFASAENGDRASSSALYAALYSELHRIASRELNRQGWGVSLGATSLLHEAYFDLSRRDGAAFPDRARFLATRRGSCEGSSWTTPGTSGRKSGADTSS
jgi:hypothetical protein